jgi:hypothetical protein
MRGPFLSICSLSLIACGGSDGSISILPLVLEPGCFVAPPPEPTVPDSDAWQLMKSAHRSILEFRISYGIQLANFLSLPIREDPTASSWSLTKGETQVEGEVLARGEDWALIKMHATTGWLTDGERIDFDAEINATPLRTTYDFGGSFLDVRPELFEYDDYLRGCDPRSGVSFEIAPVLTEHGVESQTRCWPGPVFADDVDPEVRAEFEASHRIQCLQRIESLRLF